MASGSVTGIVDGAVVGWIAEPTWRELELVVDGEGAFGRAIADQLEDGRLSFCIPIPEQLRDGRVRFLDVKPVRAARALAGGPLVFDGGLFETKGPFPSTQPRVGSDARLSLAGQVELASPHVVKGWAWAPSDPTRRLAIEIWSLDRRLLTVTADQSREDLLDQGLGDGRYGFEINLAHLLKGGPHQVSLYIQGQTEPMAGGRLIVGPFAKDGEVRGRTYLNDEKSKGLLESTPFEHFVYDTRRMSAERAVQRLINRLCRERDHLAAEDRGVIALLRLAGDQRENRGVQLWRRQSYPFTSMHDAGDSAETVREVARSAAMVVLARPGDMIHPSAAGILAGMSDVDAVVWNRFCADVLKAGSGGTLLRRPPFDPATYRHGAVVDSCVAVKGSELAACPDEVLEALRAGRLTPLFFWLASRGLRWGSHPEALTVSVGPPARPARDSVEADRALYADLLIEEGERFTLQPTPEDHPFPFVLVPARRAAKVSAIVCFRNRAELTLRCLYSISRQQLTSELEIVLVDNQSEAPERQRILQGAEEIFGAERVVCLDYPAPFNHSAQCNLGAQRASGDVILICNNDVTLETPSLVEQISAWALQDGVGTVGCRLEDPDRNRGSYGHSFAPLEDNPFRPCLKEQDDPSYALDLRACAGNTLAFAAMSRERFLEMGGLEAEHFPIGYNDMEFMLRCADRGLTHLFLGHVRALHARGSSRSGDNEVLQALRINQLYPRATAQRFLQLAAERLEAPQRSGKVASQPAQTPADKPNATTPVAPEDRH